MSATEILVVILSVALTVLLILSTILVVLLIRVTRQIQSVTNVAKTAADNMLRASAGVSKIVAPAALLKAVKNAMSRNKAKR